MEHAVPTEVLTLLAAAVLTVALFRRLRLPPVLGYLLAGVVGGPHALAWFGAGNDNDVVLQLLGELGVAFLLFAIGLEFSLPQFWAMRHTLVGLGGAQVLAGTLSGGLIAWWLGVPAPAAIVVGGALAMSSTAIVVRQLTEQFELQDAHGRLALGVLLFQDLAAVPFLVVIPILAAGPVQSQALAGALLIALAKAAAALTVLLLIGRWALRPLFHQIAAARSAELFTLTVLLIALLAAWLTDRLGLSLALGAFLSGMMLGETEYRHQIEADIRPFRDLLLGLFFITIGMRLDPAALPALWAWVALLVIGLVAGKGLLIAVLAAARNFADSSHRYRAVRTVAAGAGPRRRVRPGTARLGAQHRTCWPKPRYSQCWPPSSYRCCWRRYSFATTAGWRPARRCRRTKAAKPPPRSPPKRASCAVTSSSVATAGSAKR